MNSIAHALRIRACADPLQRADETVKLPATAAPNSRIGQQAIGIDFIHTCHFGERVPQPAPPVASGKEAAGTVRVVAEGGRGFRVGSPAPDATRMICSHANGAAPPVP
jgi:hypothetical protein